MKKYIKPTMILLEIESEGMMAGSPGISKDPATGLSDLCIRMQFVQSNHEADRTFAGCFL